MRVLAIDPGPEKSGVVLWDGRAVLAASPAFGNSSILCFYDQHNVLDHAVIEKVENYGKNVGHDVFETVFQSGEISATLKSDGWPVHRMPRREVKLHLCGSVRAKDKDIRAALVERFGKPGTYKNKGPLFGVTSHAWAALALAVTYHDLRSGG